MEQKSSSSYIDKNVIYIMLGTLLLASIVLIAKVANHDPCNIMNFEVNASQFRVGEIIRFKDYSENVTERQWSFGDSTDNRYTENPFHTYSTPGTYSVELLVNNNCSVSKEIVIKEKLDIIDSTRIANFKVPASITVGELISVTDITKKATSWEWRFGETSEVNSTFQNPTYTYQTPGLKTITLIVNGDPRYSTQKRITVLPKEEEKVVELSKRQKRKSLREAKRDRESLIKYDPVVKAAPTPPSVKISNAPKAVEKPQISRSAFAKKNYTG
ncbi:PKD domain-containing protein [Aquimarina agarivorans]|uniref:PKD domain-containing protein n=1 Tax=Aquimarina agarivorans TaxID=980584 RepID=UPI0004970243|nr:PKD domain-containing protein [Aquimarina agarivorans]